ncbi:MAG: hypothetical protein HY286_18860 [Planctomycetes bacterium]|nr:hypothetical protein [Planctomycetota bacterium]
MNSLLKTVLIAGAAFGAVLGTSSAANAQISGGGGNPEQEIKDLFKKVEKDLQEIDKLLLEAGKDAPAIQVTSANSKDVAKDALNRQKKVSENIQKILDLIPDGKGGSGKNSQQNHGLSKPPKGGGKGSQGDNNNPDNKPSGEQPQQQQQNDEKTANGAGQAQTLPQDGQQPKDPKGGGNPDDNKKSNEPPKNGQQKPRDYDTERVKRDREAADRWGDLPEHLRRTFSNENTGDLPMRYRKWIQDFYTRTSKSGSGK